MEEKGRPAPKTDVWTWMMVGVIFVGINVALWAPLIWEKTQG
jgi:hypothetical protein